MTKRTAESNDMPIAKYGMPASESHRIVEHHFVVMQERKRLGELLFAHALRQARKLRAALNSLGQR